MSRIGHYLERWLEVSAGFVASQTQLSRHPGVVISRDGWLNLDAFPYRPRYSLERTKRLPARWQSPAVRRQLDALLTLRRIDLVHVHFGYAANDVADLRHRKLPVVLSLHGHDATGLVNDRPEHYSRVVDRVDAVVVPSLFLAEAATTAGFDRDRVRVIPSGVDTALFTPSALPTGPPVVAYVGRLVEKKGLDVLLAAWPTIRAEAPAGATLHVLGDGPLAGLLTGDDRSIVHHLPLASRRHEQVRDLLSRASVVASPSRTAADGDSESLLLVNLEAGASGRPVVSTRHGGIPEYVDDGRTGLLVPEADSAALAAAVLRVLGDRRLAERLAGQAVEHVAQWDVRLCAARIDALYDELLDPRGRK